MALLYMYVKTKGAWLNMLVECYLPPSSMLKPLFFMHAKDKRACNKLCLLFGSNMFTMSTSNTLNISSMVIHLNGQSRSLAGSKTIIVIERLQCCCDPLGYKKSSVSLPQTTDSNCLLIFVFRQQTGITATHVIWNLPLNRSWPKTLTRLWNWEKPKAELCKLCNSVRKVNQRKA